VLTLSKQACDVPIASNFTVRDLLNGFVYSGVPKMHLF